MARVSRLALCVALPLVAAIACNQSLVADAAACDPSTAVRRYSAPWAELSDAQLRDEVERACGRVFVGFKEEDAPRGVDAQGRVLTSPATVERMKAYLADRGVTLEMAYTLIPAVSAHMPARLDLVAELRQHPNVDYLEPIFPGSYAGR